MIGSGPAGLAAAQQLTRAGHTVAVYERADKIGGLLRYGIPEFKMEKARPRPPARPDAARGHGLPGRRRRRRRRCTGDQLRDRYDAVVLADRARPSARDLPVPGRELGGIHQAMEYLPQSNRASLGEEVRRPDHAPTGKHVVIIGGGDTGADCLGTAIRQGAASITQLEILPEPPEDRPAGQPWPTYPMIFRVSSAHEEAGDRVYAVSTQEFLGDERRPGPRAAPGRGRRRQFQPVEGTEREIPAELVLLAMGFTGPEQRGPGRAARRRPRRARQRRPRRGVRLGVDGVFVAGDAGRGQSLIVWAIAEGRAAAAAVDTLPHRRDHPARARSRRPSARSSSDRSPVTDSPIAHGRHVGTIQATLG